MYVIIEYLNDSYMEVVGCWVKDGKFLSTKAEAKSFAKSMNLTGVWQIMPVGSVNYGHELTSAYSKAAENKKPHPNTMIGRAS